MHADDLGKVFAGEAVGAAHTGEWDEPPAGAVLDPPGRAAEDGCDFFGAVEAPQGIGGVCGRCGGTLYCGSVQGVSSPLAGMGAVQEHSCSGARDWHPWAAPWVLIAEGRGEAVPARSGGGWLPQRCGGREARRARDDDEVVDTGASWGAFDAAYGGVGHWAFQSGCRVGELTPVGALPGAEEFNDGVSRIPGRPIASGLISIAKFVPRVRRFGEPAFCGYVAPRFTATGNLSGIPAGEVRVSVAGIEVWSDVGLCVVARVAITVQGFRDVMLLALPLGGLFRQPAFRVYR